MTQKGTPHFGHILGRVFSVDSFEHKKGLNSNAGMGLEFGGEKWQMRDADEQKSQRADLQQRKMFF